MKSRKIDPELQRARNFIEWLMLCRCRLNLQGKDGKRVEVVFETVNWKEICELAANGGFPKRYFHYGWGVEFERLRKGHQYGLERISEMVINGDPVYAYLQRSNRVVDKKLVMAHVFGHADFFLNNDYFKDTNRKSIDMMANNAVRIEEIQDKYGVEIVERWIDVCRSLANLIDINGSDIQECPREEAAEDSAKWSGKLPAKAYMDGFINPKSEV